jgi:hypothetical protein
MGKHETGYERVDKDLYPTPSWVVDALAEHIDLVGKIIWECAAGTGQMVEALKTAGATVYATDIARYGYPLDEVMDFLSPQNPKPLRWHWTVTNPAWGKRNKTAEAFVARGLQRLSPGQGLALLLPVDFDSGVTRRKFFHDCPAFIGKIVLTQRAVWFQRTDGIREAPKENICWYLWAYPLLHVCRPPLILYAPNNRKEAAVAEHEPLGAREWRQNSSPTMTDKCRGQNHELPSQSREN